MSKLQVLSKKNSDKPARLIFVGPSASDQTEVIEKFAKKNNLNFSIFTEGEWATMEEIDQYIQEEELSKQISNLPIGKNQDFSLDSITKQHIKKILQLKRLNINAVARTLKIGRATLYRKLEKNGLNIKQERQNFLSKKRKNPERKSQAA